MSIIILILIIVSFVVTYLYNRKQHKITREIMFDFLDEEEFVDPTNKEDIPQQEKQRFFEETFLESNQMN